MDKGQPSSSKKSKPKCHIMEAILICEFNEKNGKQIVDCYPKIDSNSQINNESFNLIAEMILPRDELCGRFLALEFKRDYFLLSLPTLIRNKENKKIYQREKYIYSVLMLVRRQAFLSDRELYKELMNKLSYFFAILEEEKNILYKLNASSISTLLKTIYLEFEFKGEAYLEHECEHYTFISAKSLSFKAEQPIVIKPFHVPITNLTAREIQAIDIDDLRMLLREVLKGESCVKKLASIMSKSITEITQFLRMGIKFGVILMVDIFSLKNVYVLTPEIHAFAKDNDRIAKMSEYLHKRQQFIGMNGQLGNTNPKTQVLSKDELMFIYLRFNRGFTTEQIMVHCAKLLQKSGITILRLVRYGLIKGILKRCHELLINPNISSSIYKKYIDKEKYHKYFRDIVPEDSTNEAQIMKLNQELNAFVRNSATLDEVSVALGVDKQSVLQILIPEGVQVVLSS